MLGDVVLAVASMYEREHGRPPTRSEWQRLFLDAVQPIESPDDPPVRHVIAEARTPHAVRIDLAPPEDE